MFELIKKLTGVYGVSGSEEGISEVIAGEIRGYVDEIYNDALGNLIARKKGSGRKIMIAAHMDEIGVIATFIDDRGFIRFSSIGGVSAFASFGQKVRFKNGTTGAIAYEEKLEDMKNLKLPVMYIDIGAVSREDAESKVKIGDSACFIGDAIQSGDKIISKALDDRAGCAVAIKAIQTLGRTDNDIYFVFTVQEELGLRGARTAANAIAPDMAIALDVTATGDKPESRIMALKCGQGPAIKIKDSSVLCHPAVRKQLEEAAVSIGIPYQFEILEYGGTDSGAIHLTGGGVPSGVISIPTRYIHTPVETASLKDIENAVRLLVKAIE